MKIATVPSNVIKVDKRTSSMMVSDRNKSNFNNNPQERKRNLGQVRDRFNVFKHERAYFERTFPKKNNVDSSMTNSPKSNSNYDIEMGIIHNDKVKLMGDEGSSSGSSSWTNGTHSRPRWVTTGDDCKSEFKGIQQKMADLKLMHSKHLQAAFEEKDQNIEMLTSDITTHILKCQKKIKTLFTEDEKAMIKNGTNVSPDDYETNPQELLVKRNMQKNLAGNLTHISVDFRNSQQVYMQKLESKVNKTAMGEKGRVDPLAVLDQEFPDDIGGFQQFDRGFTTLQLKQVDDMESEQVEYTNQIKSLQSNIIELHEVFQDMYNLVDEQGTMLDQIDVLVENTQYNVKAAVIELDKAKELQKKTKRKMLMLLLLIAIFGVIIVILIRLIF